MLTAGKVLFLAFFDVCRLVKGPQDIPQSQNLFVICLAGYAILSLILLLFSEPVDKAMLAAMIDVALLMLFSWALLQLNNKTQRWTQTVTALLGTGTIISVIALPIYFLMLSGGGNPSVADSGNTSWLILLAALACWNIVIMGHILRHALEINLFSTIMFSIAYVWIVLSVTSMVIPVEAA